MKSISKLLKVEEIIYSNKLKRNKVWTKWWLKQDYKGHRTNLNNFEQITIVKFNNLIVKMK